MIEESEANILKKKRKDHIKKESIILYQTECTKVTSLEYENFWF